MPLDAALIGCRGLSARTRLAVVVWALILTTVAIHAFWSPAMNTVYPLYAAAARRWQVGADLYRDLPEAYRYSPLATASLTPFSCFSDRWGGVLWRLLSAAVFLGGLAGWSRVLLPRSLTQTQHSLLFLLVVPLSVGSLHNGQCNPLVLGLLLVALTAAACNRWSLAAGAVAFACSFKLYAIAIGLLLVLASPRKFGWRLAAALGVTLAVPFLLQSPSYVAAQYGDWFRALLADDRSNWSLKDSYRDLWLLCRAWNLPISREVYAGCQLLAAAGAAGLVLAGKRAGWPLPRLLDAVFALGACWMVLLGPATESATYMFLAPTLAWAVMRATAEPWPKWQRGLVVAGFGLLVVAAVAVWFPDAARLHGCGLQPLAGLLLAVTLVGRQLMHHWRSASFGFVTWEACPALAAPHEFQ